MKATRGLLALAALVAVVPGCAALTEVIGKPKLRAVRLKITGIDLQGVGLSFDVDVENPYFVPIRAPLVRYGLDIAGAEFLRSEAPLKVDLPADNIGTLTVPVHLSYSKLWSAYRSLKGAREVDYTLRGALGLRVLGQSFDLPLSHSGKFPVLRVPRFSDVRFHLSDVSLRKAKITVDALVTNPNVFEIGIDGLGYVLKVGDVQLGGLSAATAGTIGSDQSGRLTLTGEVSAVGALLQLLKGGRAGKASLVPSGSIKTPYGAARLQD